MTVLWLFGVYELVRAIPLWPVPILASLAAASGALWFRGRRDKFDERVLGWMYAAGIAAGIVGEFVHDVIVGLPPSVPRGVWWFAVGAGGIGGALGVGASAFVSISWVVRELSVFLWTHRHGPAV